MESPIIKFNVGGKIFMTLRPTITKYPESLLAIIISGRHTIIKDENGCVFIDRNPKYFEFVLDIMRGAEVDIPEEVISELSYYMIPFEPKTRLQTDFTRKEILMMILDEKELPGGSVIVGEDLSGIFNDYHPFTRISFYKCDLGNCSMRLHNCYLKDCDFGDSKILRCSSTKFNDCVGGQISHYGW